MAAKFDGKHARANMWVTHQNLAKAKGGRPLYQPPPRKPRVAPPAPKPAVPAASVTEPGTSGDPSA